MFGKKNVVGLDIGSSSIKMVELQAKGRNYHLDRFGMSLIPDGIVSGGEIVDPVALSGLIMSLHKELGIKSKFVCTGMFGGSVIVKKIFIPRTDKKLIGEQIQWEAEQYIPFDLSETSVDYHLLRENNTTTETMDVLLVAAKQDCIAGYFEAIESSGLKCSVIDINSFALANCFEVNYGVRDGVTAIINIGSKVMNLVVIEKGNMVFCRDIPMGGHAYDMEIVNELNVSPVEASELKVGFSQMNESPSELENIIKNINNILCEEIKESFKFYDQSDSGSSVNEIFLCGGSVKVPNLIKFIEESTSVKCHIFNPFQKISYSTRRFSEPFIKDVSSFLPCVLGLGIRQMGDS